MKTMSEKIGNEINKVTVPYCDIFRVRVENNGVDDEWAMDFETNIIIWISNSTRSDLHAVVFESVIFGGSAVPSQTYSVLEFGDQLLLCSALKADSFENVLSEYIQLVKNQVAEKLGIYDTAVKSMTKFLDTFE